MKARDKKNNLLLANLSSISKLAIVSCNSLNAMMSIFFFVLMWIREAEGEGIRKTEISQMFLINLNYTFCEGES